MVNLGLSQQIFDQTNNNIKAQIFVILDRMKNSPRATLLEGKFKCNATLNLIATFFLQFTVFYLSMQL